MSEVTEVECPMCGGTGSSGVHRHGPTPEWWELLRCETCDGVGRLPAVAALPDAAALARQPQPLAGAVVTEEQRREIAEAWAALLDGDLVDHRARTFGERAARMQTALRAAGLLGGKDGE